MQKKWPLNPLIRGEFTRLQWTQDKFTKRRDSYTAHQENQSLTRFLGAFLLVVLWPDINFPIENGYSAIEVSSFVHDSLAISMGYHFQPRLAQNFEANLLIYIYK